MIANAHNIVDAGKAVLVGDAVRFRSAYVAGVGCDGKVVEVVPPEPGDAARYGLFIVVDTEGREYWAEPGELYAPA